MKKLIIVYLLLLFSAQLFSQKNDNFSYQNIENLKGEKKLDALIVSAEKAIKTDAEKSIYYSHLALKVATELRSNKKIPECYFLLSDGYLHTKSPDSALYFAKKSLEGYQKAGTQTGIIRAMNQAGLANLRGGSLNEAVSTFSKTIDLCNKYLEKNPDNKELTNLSAEVFNNLMLTYIRQGNYKEAKNKLLGFAKKSDFGKTFIGMLIEGNLATTYRLLGQYDSALIRADRALQIARSLDEPLNVVKAIIDIGDTYNNMGHYSQALANYQKASEMLNSLNDKQKLATLYNNIAVVYKKISDYEKATAYFLKSLKIKEQLNDSAGVALLNNNIGLVYIDWGNYSKARDYMLKAVATNIKKNLKKGLSANYTSLGNLYFVLLNADSSLFYYTKSLELKTEMGSKDGMIHALHGIGMVYSNLLSDDPTARLYYDKALTIATEIGSEYDIAELNMSIGELLYKKQDLNIASDHFQKGLDYAIRENAFELIEKGSKNLTEINILTGKKDKALAFFRQFKQSDDSIFSKEKAQKVLELQTQYETEKKEHENQLLIKKGELQKARIRYLFGISILLLLLVFSMIYFYRLKDKAYKLLVEKDLETVKINKQLKKKKIEEVYKEYSSLEISQYAEIDDTRLELLKKFVHFIEDDKPYLNSGISLDDICRRINTNRTYLSNLINEHFKQNFNSYINDLRINEARRLLLEMENDHISVEGIGCMAGFSSKVTFHKNFKTQIGVTPSYYRKIAKSQQRQII